MPNQPQPQPKVSRPPGTVMPWEQKIKELPPMTGREDLVKKQWETYDAWAYTYLWHLVVSF
jgi:hypothetical protein